MRFTNWTNGTSNHFLRLKFLYISQIISPLILVESGSCGTFHLCSGTKSEFFHGFPSTGRTTDGFHRPRGDHHEQRGFPCAGRGEPGISRTMLKGCPFLTCSPNTYTYWYVRCFHSKLMSFCWWEVFVGSFWSSKESCIDSRSWSSARSTRSESLCTADPFAADAMASWFASWATWLNRSAHLRLRRLGTSLGLVNPGWFIARRPQNIQDWNPASPSNQSTWSICLPETARLLNLEKMTLQEKVPPRNCQIKTYIFLLLVILTHVS